MKTEREYISRRMRFAIFQRDIFTCQYCGAKGPDVKLVLDHIKPVSKGGSSDYTNLVTSCWVCNSGKADSHLREAPLAGSWDRDPLEFPPLEITRNWPAETQLYFYSGEQRRTLEALAD